MQTVKSTPQNCFHPHPNYPIAAALLPHRFTLSLSFFFSLAQL